MTTELKAFFHKEGLKPNLNVLGGSYTSQSETRIWVHTKGALDSWIPRPRFLEQQVDLHLGNEVFY